ncbi:MAG: site-specific DNA-methyltransferase [Oscillospiraceae bacterium]|nr:site-specific DNA-methyltransferase [Oscillospiraceae bacterium]
MREAVQNTGLKVAQIIIWVKNTFALGRQDYQWRHEPAVYGWKEGAAHYFTDNRTLSTVFGKGLDIDALDEDAAKAKLRYLFNNLQQSTIFEDKPIRSEDHPTMKPVRLIEKLVKNSSRPGDIVLDVFGGSGTTLIACEEAERSCRMLEIDPHYVDVIIRRWEDLTGKKAEKIEEA